MFWVTEFESMDKLYKFKMADPIGCNMDYHIFENITIFSKQSSPISSDKNIFVLKPQEKYNNYMSHE